METNNFWEIPEKLEEMGNILCMEPAERLSAMNEKIRAHYTDIPPAPYLEEQLESVKKMTYSIAVTSGQSCGKSTLLNAILGYPLLPTAQTVTTTCAVEIRYGKEPAIKILYDNPQNGKSCEKTICASAKMSPSLWKKLKEFACLCVCENIISPETLQYFSDKNIDRINITADDLEISADNPDHVMVLYLILFGAYVGQNDINENSAENRKKICRYRDNLFREFGVPQDIDYSLVALWNNDALKKGLVLMDLPGFGSIAGAVGKKESHDKVAMNYMLKADTVFMMFDGEAKADQMPEVLKILVESEKMKYIVTKENRIIPVMNKADKASNIQVSINDIRALFGSLQVPYVYPVSALWGEYRFMEAGLFPFKRSLMYKRNEKIQRDTLANMGIEVDEDQIENGLKKGLEKAYYGTYAFTGADGKAYQINLAEFIKLFTEDYIHRMRCLKGLELLNAGSSACFMMISNLQGRIKLLSVLQNGGETLAESMVAALENSIRKGIEEFNQKFEVIQTDLMDEFSNMSEKKIIPVQDSYKKALQQIEKDITSLIRIKVESMEKNWLGDIIIDENNEKAKKNLQKYNNLVDEIQKFPVTKCLQESQKKLASLIETTVRTYDDRAAELELHYKELPKTIERALAEDYEHAVSGILEKNTELTKEEFDKFYAGIFQDLIKMINTQAEVFSLEGIKKIQSENRIAIRQKDVIDKIADYSATLESVYRKLCNEYIEMGKNKTMLTNHNRFNGAAILASVDKPFFTEEIRAALANEITSAFQPYTDDMVDDIKQIRYEFRLYNANSLGSDGSIQGMKGFIKQNFGNGALDIQSQMDDINHWIAYMERSIDSMEEELAPSLEKLACCSWAKAEVDVVNERLQGLKKYRG